MSDEVKFTIRVLGRFSVEADGRPVIDRSWSRRKAQAVIKLLALRRDHAAHLEELVELLWPEMEPSAAQNNLHKNLHHIRSAVANKGIESPLVSLKGEMVELAPGVQVDADEFRDKARAALAGEEVASLEQAAGIYRGELLPEDTYEEWTQAAREDARSRYVEVMLGLAKASDRHGEHSRSIEVLQALLGVDPLNEEAHRLLMNQYAHTGSKHRALRQYQALVERLREELGTQPSEETSALFESLVGAVPESRAPTSDRAATALELDNPRRVHRNHRPVASFGREEELERAQDFIDRAQAGEGRAILVWGEAGIGKSHFVSQIIADAEDLGFLAVATRCSEFEATSAYQPFRDLLQLIGGPEDEVLRHSAYLRRILFGTSERDDLIQDPNRFQTELFNETHRLLQKSSGPRPLLVCLEDFHEADADSVRMFHFLARRVADLKVLLIASVRKEGIRQSQLPQVVASLRRENQVTEFELKPLDEQAMALLVESLFGETRPKASLLREILDHAEGNPLFATEMVHTLVQEGWAEIVDGRWTRKETPHALIPTAVNEFLDFRLRHLSPNAQALIQFASVYGRAIDYSLLREVLELSERDALDALDQCIDAHIIEETPDGYRFRHDLLREGIYERTTRVRRQSLHKAVATALVSKWPEPLRSPRVQEIAHHYALSDDSRLAIPFLIESGRRAASVFANEQAVTFYRQAISLLDEHPDALALDRQAAAVEALGDIERRMGNNQRAVELFERSQGMHSAIGDREAAARARGKAALGHIMLGQSELARDQVAATLQDLTEASPKHVVSRTYYLLAQLHWHSGDNREALEAAERALGAARDSEDPAEKAQAFEVMALACHSLGDWKRGVELELERQSLGVPGFNTDEAFEAHL